MNEVKNKKIETRFPHLEEKIALYRNAKKSANVMKYLFKISKTETDKVIFNAHIEVENKCLQDVKEEILNLLRSNKYSVSMFSYWLNRKARNENI